MADAGWCWVLLAGDGCCWVMLDAVFQHCLRAFLRAFLFCSSTFFVRIPTVFRHCLTRKRTQEEHIMRAFLLHFYYFPALSSVRISTVFQHCRRAFLLCSSTQCCTQCTQCCALLRRNACTQCWNAAGMRTGILVRIPTVFQHRLTRKSTQD